DVRRERLARAGTAREQRADAGALAALAVQVTEGEHLVAVTGPADEAHHLGAGVLGQHEVLEGRGGTARADARTARATEASRSSAHVDDVDLPAPRASVGAGAPSDRADLFGGHAQCENLAVERSGTH